MGLLDDGESWLADLFAEQESVLVTLRRGEEETADVPAVLGQSDAVSDDESDRVLTSRSFDLCILVANYRIGGTVVVPTAGDKYELTLNGNVVVLEATPFADEPAARHTGPNRLEWRIHTLQTSE